MSVARLANGRVFEVDETKSLLDSARNSKILLPHSCRTGRCGECKARVLSGETKILLPEQSLALPELDEGVILTCCRSAVSDVDLDISDLGSVPIFDIKTMPCRIESIEYPISDILKVTLRTPPSTPLAFAAGQYINVSKAGVRRSYSLANAPRDDNKLELQIRCVDGGALSAFWFGGAKINDLLHIEGPYGTFSLEQSPSSSIVFLATGTGIAPVKAMLEEIDRSAEWTNSTDIRVYWGGRHEQDIYWTPVFPNLNLNFVPVLSRPPQGWAGRKGHVQDILLEDGVDIASTLVYACGSERMISSARDALLREGLPAIKFHADAFLSSS